VQPDRAIGLELVVVGELVRGGIREVGDQPGEPAEAHRGDAGDDPARALRGTLDLARQETDRACRDTDGERGMVRARHLARQRGREDEACGGSRAEPAHP
jgi:hypothetical protein